MNEKAADADLGRYLDSLETLPSEFEQNLTLIHDLDVRAQEELKVIDKLSQEYLNNVESFGPEEKNAKKDKIHELYKKAQAYADDKIELSRQNYEMVEKHIEQLDSVLKKKVLNLQSSDSETSRKKKGRKAAGKVEKKGRRVVSSDDDAPKAQKKKEKGRNVQPEISTLTALTSMTHPSDVFDMPVDPNEPTYCSCNQVSYGEMIWCDNPNCPIEWFHFACVGLASKPKGKWYCSKCSAERKKK